MSNVQFRKTSDPAIARLIDPARGYVLTCTRCNKHMKEEAVAAHLCEGEKIEAEGIEFVRDASMRYRCTICNVTVPIVLVRAHAVRHPKPRLEEEEWSDICGAVDKLKPGFVATKKLEADSKAQEDRPGLSTKLAPSNEANEAPSAGRPASSLVPPSQTVRPAAPLTSASLPQKSALPPQFSTSTLSPLPPKSASSIPPSATSHSTASPQFPPASTPQAQKPPVSSPVPSPKPPTAQSEVPSRPALSMVTVLYTEVRGKRQGGEVSYCLRKVRRVELSFVRAFRVYGRAAYCRELYAFQQWRRASKH